MHCSGSLFTKERRKQGVGLCVSFSFSILSQLNHSISTGGREKQGGKFQEHYAHKTSSAKMEKHQEWRGLVNVPNIIPKAFAILTN